MLASQTIAAPLRARAARRVRTSASQRAGVVCSAKPEHRVNRREAVFTGAAALVAALTLAPAREANAFLGFGDDGAAETNYVNETTAVIAQIRETLALDKDDPKKADSIAATRKKTNDWVAKYRRDGKFTTRPSYGNVYSALNAVAGHYNSFGTKYPLPVKRAERVTKELADAELLLGRGR